MATATKAERTPVKTVKRKKPAKKVRQDNLFDLINHNPDCNVFPKLALHAGISSSLIHKGPYTVFVPSDDAFSHMDSKEINALLKPENRAQLCTLVSFHIVQGINTSDDLKKTDCVRSMFGQEFELTDAEDGLTVSDAHILSQDIGASNGIVHVIDSVLEP